jgi:hypothetical protein
MGSLLAKHNLTNISKYAYVLVCMYVCMYLLEDYRLIVKKRFSRPNDAESYAGGSVSSW